MLTRLTRANFTLTLNLLTFVEDGGYQYITSLHRDEATALDALAALMRERWHRVAGRDLGDGRTVPATAENLSTERTIALYEETMEHFDTPDNQPDGWSIEERPVKLNLAALVLGMLYDAAFGPHTS